MAVWKPCSRDTGQTGGAISMEELRDTGKDTSMTGGGGVCIQEGRVQPVSRYACRTSAVPPERGPWVWGQDPGGSLCAEG